MSTSIFRALGPTENVDLVEFQSFEVNIVQVVAHLGSPADDQLVINILADRDDDAHGNNDAQTGC